MLKGLLSLLLKFHTQNTITKHDHTHMILKIVPN